MSNQASGLHWKDFSRADRDTLLLLAGYSKDDRRRYRETDWVSLPADVMDKVYAVDWAKALNRQ